MNGDYFAKAPTAGDEVGRMQHVDGVACIERSQLERQRPRFETMMRRGDHTPHTHADGQPVDLSVTPIEQRSQAQRGAAVIVETCQRLHQPACVVRDAGAPIKHQAAIDGDVQRARGHDASTPSCRSSQILAGSPPP